MQKRTGTVGEIIIWSPADSLSLSIYKEMNSLYFLYFYFNGNRIQAKKQKNKHIT